MVSESVANRLNFFTVVMTSSIIRLSDNALVVLADNKSSVKASSEIDVIRFHEMKSSVVSESVVNLLNFFIDVMTSSIIRLSCSESRTSLTRTSSVVILSERV